MLVHIKQVVKAAQKGGFAIGAFNVNNLETVLAITQAAEKLQSPVIIQMTEGAIEYAGLSELTALVKAAADGIKAPVALHLDHGHSWPIIKKCIDIGFSSVMIDGSSFPYKKNLAVTKKVVEYAHERNVWVQGEIGRLEGSEDWINVAEGEDYLTLPADAKRFAKESGVDTLAIAIGNYHGVNKIIEKKTLRLDLKRLAEIAKIVRTPLVLHGASGFPAGQIKKAISLGIRIVNIDSELRISFAEAERDFLKKNKDVYDPRKILTPAIKEMQKTVEKKIKVLGSSSL